MSESDDFEFPPDRGPTRRRLLLGAAGAGLAAVGGAALLGRGGDDTAGASRRTTLTLGVASFPASGLSAVTKNSFDRNIKRLFFDPLLGIDREGRFTRVLAESCERVADTRWRLRIRRGVRFSDGRMLSVADAIHALEAMQLPLSLPLPGVQGWRNFRALDADTIEFDTFAGRDSDVPALDLVVEAELADICFVGNSLVERASSPEELALSVHGSGPYRLASYDPGNLLVAEAKPDYWRGRQTFDTVHVRAVPDTNTRVSALITGAIDITPIELNQIERVERSSTAYVTSALDQRAWISQLNLRNPALRSPEVRRAFNYAVDKQAIINAFFAGRGAPLASVALPGTFGRDDTLEPYAYDPRRAKAMLDAAGWNYDTVLTNAVNASYRDVCLAIGEYLSAIGVRIRSNVLDAAKHQEQQRTGTAGDIFTVAFFNAAMDMGFMYGQIVLSTAGTNYNKFSNPEIDAAITDAGNTADPSARARRLREVDRMVHEDPPYIFLLNGESAYGVSNRVRWSARGDGIVDVMNDISLA